MKRFQPPAPSLSGPHPKQVRRLYELAREFAGIVCGLLDDEELHEAWKSHLLQLVEDAGKAIEIDAFVPHYDPSSSAQDLTTEDELARWRQRTGKVIMTSEPVAGTIDPLRPGPGVVLKDENGTPQACQEAPDISRKPGTETPE